MNLPGATIINIPDVGGCKKIRVCRGLAMAKPRLPLTRVTPHSVRRCHEVTEETAAVSGCRAKRD